MRKIGEVREIWRYPVSSLRGERLETASLVATGVDGDRIVGLFDADTLTVANPDSEKRWRVAPQMEARLAQGSVEIRANGSDWLAAGSMAASQAARSVLGFDAVFRVFGEPLGDGTKAAAPRYQRGGLHVLTTASLRALAARVPDPVEIDRRRFRPNLVIETGPEFEGFREREWIGQGLSIGAARVSITEPCERCSFVALAQAELSFAPPVLHAIARHGGGGFGVLCAVEQPASVSVGDAVFLS